MRCEAQQAKKLDFVDSKSKDEGRWNLWRIHHLKFLGRIDVHRWENNRKNARSGSYAPRTSSTYQSW
jgi:hypothetical protein